MFYIIRRYIKLSVNEIDKSDKRQDGKRKRKKKDNERHVCSYNVTQVRRDCV